MGCFCKQAAEALRTPPDETGDQAGDQAADQPDALEPTPQSALVTSASRWLSAHWLPAPPWQPDPAWLDDELPPPPLPPDAMATVLSLVQAGQQCRTTLGIDLADPDGPGKLTRIVATLNRRTDTLREIDADGGDGWEAIAALNDDADAVRAAVAVFDPAAQGQDDPAEDEPPIAPWRPFLTKLKALAPMVAIGQMLDLDLSDPDAAQDLAGRVRTLRLVTLPLLADSLLVLRLASRAAAVERLARSLGQDPRRLSATQAQDVVQAKVAAVAAMLPDTLRAGPEGLLGMPPRQPNPTALANPDVVARAQRLPRAPLPWKVPAPDTITLLTTGAPVLTLIRLLGPGVVRDAPCGRGCDAAQAAREAATAPPGIGTGAAPAA